MSLDKPLRGALIGYGFIASQGHVPVYVQRMREHRDVEIVAVADVCEARRSLVFEQIPEARIYTSYDILLEEEGNELDFVDIATPPCFHAPIGLAALERGLHVLCEKPLTTTLDEARQLLASAQRTKRVLFPCHNYKHAPVVKAIRRELDLGTIGKPRELTLCTFRNTHAKGVPEWRTHWRRERHFSGGGIAMDHGSHTLYLTFDWLGGYPTAITAKMANLEPGKWDTEDNFSAVLTFPNGLAHVHLTWTAGVRKVIYTVQGNQGAVRVEDDNFEIATMHSADRPDVAQGAVDWSKENRTLSSHWMDASHVQWFSSLFDQFRAAIEKGDYVGKEAREAYLCIQIITKAYESAENGCREIALSTEVPM